MRRRRNIVFILGAALLILGLGFVTVQAQRSKQREIKNPKDQPPIVKPTVTPTRIRPKLSDSSGPVVGGNSVTITGAGFNDRTQVTFGNVPAEIIKPILSDTITVVVPPQQKAGPVSVALSTPGKKYSTARYQYATIPLSGAPSALAITRIEPSIAFPDKETIFKISGRGFEPQTEVQIEGRSFAADVADAGQLQVIIPSGSFSPGPVDITVRNLDNSRSTLVNGLTFVGSKIFWLEPNRGGIKGGEHVRIFGRYLKFKNLGDVRFGGIGITDAGQPSDNEHTIDVVTPPHNRPGWVDVVIYNAHGQTTTLNKAYYYEDERGPAAEPLKYFRLRFWLREITVFNDGAEGKGSSWSFDIRVNGKPLCDLESRTYREGGLYTEQNYTFDICRKEIEIEESEVRIRIIGTRGEVWVQGERTLPLSAITPETFPTGIGLMVEGNYRMKGSFIFKLGAEIK